MAPDYGQPYPNQPGAWAGQPYGRPPKAPPNFKLISIVLGVALIISLCGIAGLLASGSGAARGEKTRVWAMSIGDCFGREYLKGSGNGYAMVVPCRGPHNAELFFSQDVTDASSLPESDQWDAWVHEYCYPAFEAYIGRPVEDSDYSISWVFPGQVSWDEGIRTLFCYASLEDDVKGTFRNSNR